MLLPGVTFSQAHNGFTGIPPDATLIEVQPLSSSRHANRALVLWMSNPKKSPQGDSDDPYTCPDTTSASSFYGPTRVSLVDTATRNTINTLKIKRLPDGDTPEEDGPDEFAIPYWIRPDYYHVTRPLRKGEGKPAILYLKDYNSDGKLLEFALFDARNCSVVLTQLIGYSETQDRVIRYPIRLQPSSTESSDTFWFDHFLLEKPVRPGFWKFTLSYNTGDVFTYSIHYDPAHECFVGRVSSKKQ